MEHEEIKRGETFQVGRASAQKMRYKSWIHFTIRVRLLRNIGGNPLTFEGGVASIININVSGGEGWRTFGRLSPRKPPSPISAYAEEELIVRNSAIF